MLLKLFISTCAVMLVITSPMLHFWEHAVDAHELSECCGSCQDPEGQEPSDSTPPPIDMSLDCDCYTRVAIPEVPPCDISELAFKSLPADSMLATFGIAIVDAGLESSLSYRAPVHFALLSDAGQLRAHLGRYQL
jgi:hypothetical protein